MEISKSTTDNQSSKRKEKSGANPQVIKQTKIKSGKRKIILIGAILGFITAFFGLIYQSKRPELLEFAEYVALQMTDIDLGRMVTDNIIMEDIFGNLTSILYPPDKIVGDVTPGLRLKEEGAKPKHPVFFIPGIISTGLENWSMQGCSKKYFRKRFWGTLSYFYFYFLIAMFKTVLMDKACWLENMSLDPVTGLDPEGIKIRAAQGLDAADYFISGYWVWGKLIENFAAVGYDNNNMHLAAYDWRLTYPNLEIRDNYFTKLKTNFELSKSLSGEKAVILTHSMGCLIFHYFMKWVESDSGGKGGPEWVENHINSIVNIAGALLGAPKTITTLISGESRETVQPMTQYIMDHFLNKTERANLFRGWGGLASLIPKGGTSIWGDLNSAPDDEIQKQDENLISNGNFFMLQNKNLTVTEAIDLLLQAIPSNYSKQIKESYSYGVVKSESEFRHHDPLTWSNPLESQLPNSPSLSIYCLYGHGLDAERHYYYNALNATKYWDPKYIIDVTLTNQKLKLLSGVRSVNGDGSVPLISLGYMCLKGWKNPLFNPSGVKTVSREYKHSPAPVYEDMRGGQATGEHIDILGNFDVTMDALKIATGYFNSTEMEDRIESNIRDIIGKVNI